MKGWCDGRWAFVVSRQININVGPRQLTHRGRGTRGVSPFVVSILMVWLNWDHNLVSPQRLMKSKLAIIAAMASIACAGLPSHALTAQQQFDLCRSVMENRPYNPATDGPNPKPMNSIGYGAYPPPDQRGIWIDNECSEIPGIYVPFWCERTEHSWSSSLCCIHPHGLIKL